MLSEHKFPPIDKTLFRISSTWQLRHSQNVKFNRSTVQQIMQDPDLFRIARAIKAFQAQLLQILTMLAGMHENERSDIKIHRIVRVLEYLEVPITGEQLHKFCANAGLLVHRDEINFRKLVKVCKKAYDTKQETQLLLMKSLHAKLPKPKTPPKRKKVIFHAKSKLSILQATHQKVIRKHGWQSNAENAQKYYVRVGVNIYYSLLPQFNSVEYCFKNNQPIAISFIDDLNTKTIPLHDPLHDPLALLNRIRTFHSPPLHLPAPALSSLQGTNFRHTHHPNRDSHLENHQPVTLKAIVLNEDGVVLQIHQHLPAIRFLNQYPLALDETSEDEEEQNSPIFAIQPITPKAFHSAALFRVVLLQEYHFCMKLGQEKSVQPLQERENSEEVRVFTKKQTQLQEKPVLERWRFIGNCEIAQSPGETALSSSSSEGELCDEPILAQKQVRVEEVRHHYVQPQRRTIIQRQQKRQEKRNYRHHSTALYVKEHQFQQCSMMSLHKWEQTLRDSSLCEVDRPEFEKSGGRVFLEDEVEWREVGFEARGKEGVARRNEAVYEKEESSDSFEFEEEPQELQQPPMPKRQKKEEEVEKRYIAMTYDNGNGIDKIKIFVRNSLVSELQGLKHDNVIWDIVFNCEEAFKMHETHCHEVDLVDKQIEAVTIKTRQVQDQVLFCCFQLEALEQSVQEVPQTYLSKSVHTSIQQESVADQPVQIQDFFDIVEVKPQWNLVTLELAILYSLDHFGKAVDLQRKLMDLFPAITVQLGLTKNKTATIDVLIKDVGPLSKRVENNMYPIYRTKKNAKEKSLDDILEEVHDQLCLLIWDFKLQ